MINHINPNEQQNSIQASVNSLVELLRNGLLADVGLDIVVLQVGIDAGVEHRLRLRLGGVEILFEGQFLRSHWQRRENVDSVDKVGHGDQVPPVVDQTGFVSDALPEVSANDVNKVEEFIFFCKIDQLFLLLRIDLRRSLEIISDFLLNVLPISVYDANDEFSLI